MFAKRTEWDLSENPLSLELNDLKGKGVRVFDLTESNPTKAGIAYPPQLLDVLADPANFIYSPDPKGMFRAREAVVGYYRDKGVDISPESLILTSSSSEAYAFLFRLLMDPQDRVLLPAPSYPLFSYLAGLSDVQVAYYRVFFDGKAWRIDFDSLEDAADRDAKAVILVSPNNPTGSCIKADEIKRLNACCAQREMAIISDEVFADYIFDGTNTACKSMAANTDVLSFAIGGLSKAVALPQMKLGWIAVNGPEKTVHQALGRLEVIADTFLSVNTPVQNAAPAWLASSAVIQDAVMVRVRANYDHLVEAFASMGQAKVFPVDGGWYAVIQAKLGMPEDEWALKLLREEHVSVHPGFFFDFDEEGFIVVSLLTKEEDFHEGIKRLLQSIEK